MISRTYFAVLAALATAPNLASADVHAGKELTDAHCYQCHGAEVYTRPDRKVQSMSGLQKQVQMCNQALGTTLFDEQVNDVASYLNQEFYKFK